MSVFVGARISDKGAFSNLSATRTPDTNTVSRYRAGISHNVEGILYLAGETKDCILYLARFATNQTLRIVEIQATGLGHNGIVFGRWKRVS